MSIVRIPADQKQVFLPSEIFEKGSNDSPSFGAGESRFWWQACSLGMEDGELVVYICWFAT